MPYPTTLEDRQLRLRVAISDMMSRYGESIHQATIAGMTDRDRDAQRHNRAARRRYNAVLRLTRMLAKSTPVDSPVRPAYDALVRIGERLRDMS